MPLFSITENILLFITISLFESNSLLLCHCTTMLFILHISILESGITYEVGVSFSNFRISQSFSCYFSMNNLSIFDGSRVVVTGHTGFKGSWLSLWLASLGAQVHGISLGVPTTPSHYHAARLNALVHDNWLDIRELVKLKDLINKINLILFFI